MRVQAAASLRVVTSHTCVDALQVAVVTCPSQEVLSPSSETQPELASDAQSAPVAQQTASGLEVSQHTPPTQPLWHCCALVQRSPALRLA